MRTHSTLSVWMITGIFAGLFCGCAPSLSTMKPAQVTGNQGNIVHGGISIDTPIPLTGIFDIIQNTLDLSDVVLNGGELTDTQVQELLDGSAGLLLSSPGATFGAQFAYGINESWEVDAAINTSDFRLGGRFQFLHADDHSIDGTVGLGAAIGISSPSLPSPLDKVLSIDAATRILLDVPVTFGWSWDIGHFWFGTKLTYVHYTYDLNVEYILGQYRAAGLTGNSFYLLGVLGGALGYKYVWVTAELSLGQLLGGGTFDITSIGSRDVDTSGFLIVPSFGLMTRF